MPRLTYREKLRSGWTFKQNDADEDAWLPVANVPTVCHMDLIDNNRIPDPFIGLNELGAEWVGEKSWTYRTSFPHPDTIAGESVHLLFEGLDTFATVKLNNTIILENDNMFLSHRIEVSSLLQPENTLEIDFESALLRARQLEKDQTGHKFIAFNGEPGRMAVRKAQYHWGWDWGPVLMTAGPWRPVILEVSAGYISDDSINYQLDENLSMVKGTMQIRCEGSVDCFKVSIAYNEDIVFSQTSNALNGSAVNIPFTITDPMLWFPIGYGDQALYEITIEAIKDEVLIDRITRKTGFRRVELCQKEDAHGESFYFRVNNIDVFAGGSCWIPADSFLPRITPDKYRDWIKIMSEGNQVMVRVWGGGIYEDDAFYDACDEFGVLVWQDFMFACGSYPAPDSLRESVDKEARQNIKRLRHHPSIALYCGNNEDYQAQEHNKLDYDWENKDPESWLKSTFPARYYYEHSLPTAVPDLSPGVPYWPGSPFSSKGREANDKKAGDIHQWNFWHGYQEKYQVFDKNGGRFVSEFGLQGFPQLSTVKEFAEDQSDLYPGSRSVDFHNKAYGYERRIATYVVENFRPLGDLEGHIYLSQLMQSESLAFAYKGWRRQWGQERLCGGALVWQLNDCWPCTSWAIVDYHLRKKPAFYAIARQMQPIAVCVQKEHKDWSVGHTRPSKTTPYDVWVVSNKTHEVRGDVEVRFISVLTGNDIKPAIRKTDVPINSNGTTNVYSGATDNDKEEPHVISVKLLMNEEVISRDVDWPQPFKYLSFPERGVDVQTSNNSYIITVQRPTKGLVLEETDGVTLSDNGIDLVPGETYTIKVAGHDNINTLPQYRFLGQTNS